MSGKEEKDGSPFSWWKDESVRRIARLSMEAALKRGRIEAHRLKDGSTYLEFFDADGNELGGENESFVCPPICWP